MSILMNNNGGGGKMIIRASGGGGGPSGVIPFNANIDDPTVSLLLHGNGSNGGTTFTDSSFLPSTVIGHGGIALSTAQSKFGGSSILFNRSSNQYLTITDVDKFTLGTGDFTIESWIYLNSMPSGELYSDGFWICGWGEITSPIGMDFYIGTSNIHFSPANYSSSHVINCAHGFSTNTWYHVALVRLNGVVTLYVNGTSLASASYSGSVYTPTVNGIAVGAAEPVGATLGNFDGYMDDLRICKGVAKYTANFTSPVSQLSDAYDPTFLPSSPVAGQLAASNNALYVCVDATGPIWKRLNLSSI